MIFFFSVGTVIVSVIGRLSSTGMVGDTRWVSCAIMRALRTGDMMLRVRSAVNVVVSIRSIIVGVAVGAGHTVVSAGDPVTSVAVGANNTFMAVTRLSVLVMSKGITANSSGLSVVAVANVIGGGVLRQGVFVMRSGSTSLRAEAAQESLLASRARGVVVGWAWSKALLLASVTNQDELN